MSRVRGLRATAMAMLACMVLAPVAHAQTSPWPAPDPARAADRAVELVLAQDPRFADALDFERQRILASSTFDTVGSLLSVDYYRALPTQASLYSPWWVDFGFEGSWIVEVVLVRDCAEPSDAEPPLPDPCSWRHAWYYRVAPDDTVTLLFEEGHPEPPPASG